eukprot:5240145-Lingulodinium_polyedra.AAC.1
MQPELRPFARGGPLMGSCCSRRRAAQVVEAAPGLAVAALAAPALALPAPGRAPAAPRWHAHGSCE